MSEFTEAEKEALTACRPREYKHALVRRSPVSGFRDENFRMRNFNATGKYQA